MKTMLSAEYSTFLKELKERIHKAQYAALKAVNKELIALYWDIGKSIVSRQDDLGWGKSVVETLARDCDFSRAFRHLFFTTIPPGPAL